MNTKPDNKEHAKPKTDKDVVELAQEESAPEVKVDAGVERRRPVDSPDMAAIKAWVRRELDLHAAGVDHNERELQNP